MQHVLGGSLHKNNTSYLLLGLYHASVKKMNCIMGSVKKANWTNLIYYLAVNKTRVFFKLTIDFSRRI